MEPCLFRHGKGVNLTAELRQPAPLQWSHVFSDMVSCCRGAVLRIRPAASMEPCLFRHGKEEGRDSGCRVHPEASMEPCLFRHGKAGDGLRREDQGTRFNGAMSFQTW